MLRIQQLKLDIGHSEEELVKKMGRLLKVGPKGIEKYHIVKKSLDARNKQQIQYSYTIDVELKKEKTVLHTLHKQNIMPVTDTAYEFPKAGDKSLKERPVIIGSGPAGLFCAYMLAKHGYQPILLERGAAVEERMEDVSCFWDKGILKTDSNIQFGEGGAGTFSDGKLNTLNKDPRGRNRLVLSIFAECGAPEEILYENKPHLGTDYLVAIVKNMRSKIREWGGEIRFHARVTDFLIANSKIQGVMINDKDRLAAKVLVLAIGHSARDTFENLYQNKVPMEAKAFAVGFRVEHLQKLINIGQYGERFADRLPPADYKLTAKAENGRGVYTFCMCPGGFVVNASSEKERLVVNGMSYHDRNSKNANSAVIVTVTTKDFKGEYPLCGVEFQRNLEEKAYRAAGGKIPVQLLSDFKQNRISQAFGRVIPCMKGGYEFADLTQILPASLKEAFIDGIGKFNEKIPGFSADDTVLSGVESRTSSPVRILRNDDLESPVKGLYPCGEGAGFAGGITSAAIDGVKVAESIAKAYKAIIAIN